MMIQFTIENFRSIRGSEVISFAASKDRSFEENLLHPDTKKELLPAVALYGANAAGKSNVLQALFTMKEMVTGSASALSRGEKLPWEPFGGNEEPTSFEVVFIYRSIRYAYGFSYDENRICSEYLYHWPNGREALIFSREGNIYEFRENISEQTVLSRRTPDNRLYLVSSNDWNLPQTEKPYRWFLEQLTFVREDITYEQTVSRILQSDEEKNRILKELFYADLGITDVVIRNTSGKKPVIITSHRSVNDDGSVETFSLLLEKESAGTQCFFQRIGAFLKALETGSLLVVDEIEDSLHPLLTKRLIQMMMDHHINTTGAQLLFTTHDAMLLDLNLFRRDQIWFADKDDKTCSTELFSLSSFSVRKGENIRNGYLQGRYGAIPFIKGN